MSEKCKNNTKFNVQPCHCERSSAIHKTRNPHVISRLTGNPGNKDFNASWMPDQVGHDSGIVSQSGRSMVEMLGTLAIVGVLSAGAIGGYSYAMNKHRTNELIYEATKRAQWVGTQLEMNPNAQNIGFGGFGTDTFGGGKFNGTVKTDLANPNQFGIVVSGLKEAVCENIVKSLQAETNGVVRAVKTTDGTTDFDRNNCDDNAEFLLVFNRDLSVNDSEITPNESEVSGEVSEQASVATEATATQNPDDEHCNGNGSWNGSSCYCDNGWQGDNCSEEEPESSETATGEHEPEETVGRGDAECNYHGEWISGVGACNCDYGYGGTDCSEDHTCSGNGTWYQSENNGAGRCGCYDNWGGSDCSEDKSNACSGHGRYVCGSHCNCNAGWEGDDCSGGPNALYCNSHGTWCGSFCFCDSGWGGNDCSQGARAACNNNGTWYGGGCSCNTGWGGSDCSEDHTNDCSGHGNWYQSYNNGAGGCSCDSGWGGSDCSKCSGHGYWNSNSNNGAGGCSCKSGWGGSDCSEDGNALYCSGHGTWYQLLNNGAGGCSCNTGWRGADCSIQQ